MPEGQTFGEQAKASAVSVGSQPQVEIVTAEHNPSSDGWRVSVKLAGERYLAGHRADLNTKYNILLDFFLSTASASRRGPILWK